MGKRLPDELRPVLRIGSVAELLEVHPRTLRLYEERGLIRPVRARGQRRYTSNDVRWLRGLRSMVHEKGYSLSGVAKLLDLAPCWEVKGCPPEVRDSCEVGRDPRFPCWEVEHNGCQGLGQECEGCELRISRSSIAKSR